MHFAPAALARCAGLALFTTALVPNAGAVTVDADLSVPTLIAALSAGQTYSVTASGIADLLVGFNGGEGLTFTADGKPTYAFSAPYAALYPAGLDYDPSAGMGAYGLGGPGKLVGSLLGTYDAAPSGPADYFSIGLGTTLTPTSAVTLYGLINDTYASDNGGGYSVSVEPVSVTAVPEPQTGTLLLAGLGVIGWAARRRHAAS